MKYSDKNILFIIILLILFQLNSCLSHDHKIIPYQVDTGIIEIQYEILYIEDVAIFFPWQLNYIYTMNNSNSIFFGYNIYYNITYWNYFNYMNLNLSEENNDSLMDRIYSFNETLGDYLLSYYNLFEFIDAITGGPERRRQEEIEENRRWNILNPSQPRRLPDR